MDNVFPHFSSPGYLAWRTEHWGVVYVGTDRPVLVLGLFFCRRAFGRHFRAMRRVALHPPAGAS